MPENKKSPYNICTWLDKSNCARNNCSLEGRLACRWNPAEYNYLMGIIQPPVVLIMVYAFIMLGIITGNWWSMAIFVWFIIMWPLGLEPLVLCRHCPFYADCGKTITCWALRWMPKWWKYDPHPLNRFEKFIILYTFFIIPCLIWPIGWMGYGVYFIAANYQAYGLAALLGMIGTGFALVVTGIQFILAIRGNYCTRCVNFSCPMNRVPKDIVDSYLELNPIMKDAWINSGYKIEK